MLIILRAASHRPRNTRRSRRGPRGYTGQAGDGVIYHLGDLPPRSVVALPEVEARAWLARTTALVPTDYLVTVGRRDEYVEGAGGWHVVEIGDRRAEQRPACRRDDYLGELGP